MFCAANQISLRQKILKWHRYCLIYLYSMSKWWYCVDIPLWDWRRFRCLGIWASLSQYNQIQTTIHETRPNLSSQGTPRTRRGQFASLSFSILLSNSLCTEEPILSSQCLCLRQTWKLICEFYFQEDVLRHGHNPILLVFLFVCLFI